MIRRIDRYLLRELSVPLIVGTLGVLLMFQANLLIAVLKKLSMSSMPVLAIFQLIWYETPFFLSMTLPIGVSLGASLAMSRLTRESELTALRAAGCSIRRAMVPIMVVGALVGVGNFFLVERVVPESKKQSAKRQVEMAILGAAPEFKSNVIVNLKNYTASFGTVMRGSEGNVDFTDALLIERQRVGEVHVYQARSGNYRAGVITLHGALLRVFKDDELTEVGSRKDVVINEPISINDIFVPPAPDEQTAEQLGTAIVEMRQQQRDTTNLEIAYHVKYSLPASCFVFALVAPVFAIWLGRSGGFIGVLLSFMVVLLYYNAFIISTEILGKNSYLSPWMAAWLPNLLFLSVGFLVLRRLE